MPSTTLLPNSRALLKTCFRCFLIQAARSTGVRIRQSASATGGYLSYRTVYDCFKRVMTKLGLPETRFHDLRHTYAVAAIKRGDDIKTVQENLGHATAAFTLDVFGHVTNQMKEASASRMELFISAVSS